MQPEIQQSTSSYTPLPPFFSIHSNSLLSPISTHLTNKNTSSQVQWKKPITANHFKFDSWACTSITTHSPSKSQWISTKVSFSKKKKLNLVFLEIAHDTHLLNPYINSLNCVKYMTPTTLKPKKLITLITQERQYCVQSQKTLGCEYNWL